MRNGCGVCELIVRVLFVLLLRVVLCLLLLVARDVMSCCPCCLRLPAQLTGLLPVPRVHADGPARGVVGPVVVFPRHLDGGALAAPAGVLGQHAVAHGGAALEGEAELAAVAEAVDDVVAVDGALCGGERRSKVSYVFFFLFRSIRALALRGMKLT